MELTFFIILSSILAGLLKGFVGMGLSLVMIAVLFNLGIEPSNFLPILVPIFITLDAILYFENSSKIKLDAKENFTLHPATLMTLFLGIITGAYLLDKINAQILETIFAIVTLIFLIFLFEKRTSHDIKIPSEKDNAAFGGVAGVLTGLFTLNALPASMYLLYHHYPKKNYMATLVTFLVFSDILLVATYLLKDNFTLQGLLISLELLVFVMIGFGVGILLRRIVSNHVFKTIVLLTLALNSFKILMMNFFFI